MDKLKILNSIVPGYAENFAKGQYGFEEMPLLNALCSNFQKLPLPDLQKTLVIACQHLLQPQVEMFQWLIKLGLPAGNIWILPKVYSANQLIAQELISMGCFVVMDALKFRTDQDFDTFHKFQCDEITKKAFQEIPSESKVIILDDGGMLLSSFAKQYDPKSPFKIYGVEQTASGKNIVLNNSLPFIVTSVASSVEKIEIETGYIIRHAVKRVFEYFDNEKISKDAKVLVLGKGPIGNTLINSLIGHGFSCIGYDVKEKHNKPVLAEFDVIIGATGKTSVSIEDLPKLKYGCHLISVSSSDREFPSVFLRTHSIMGSHVHDTFISSVNNIHLVNGGFPITFKAERIECYPLEMDVTMMKLTEGVLNHIMCKTDFEDSIQDIKLQKLTPWVGRNALFWIIIIFVVGLLQLVLGIQLVIPNSTEAHVVGILFLIWGCGPSFFYFKYWCSLIKLLPE